MTFRQRFHSAKKFNISFDSEKKLDLSTEDGERKKDKNKFKKIIFPQVSTLEKNALKNSINMLANLHILNIS